MDISSAASLATSLSETATNQAIGISLLKKAINIESAGALALINAIPSTSSASLPPNLGQNINITV